MINIYFGEAEPDLVMDRDDTLNLFADTNLL